MIKGICICFTDLDAYKHEKWPTTFCVEPKLESWVESESGKRSKVHKIIHCEKPIKQMYPNHVAVEPFIKVELYAFKLI